MKNAAGDYSCDNYLLAELIQAGIKPIHHVEQEKGEVPAHWTGELHGWIFHRAWHYWVASGPALPFKYANPLHELIGDEVRVDGHCGCPSPEAWYGKERKAESEADLASPVSQALIAKIRVKNPNYQPKPWPDGVPHYHVDSQDGLNALAIAIRVWERDKENAAKESEKRERSMKDYTTS